MIRALRILGLVLPLLLGLAVVTVARADGEAGVVIQHGDGSIDTYCVPFTGDSITGKDLLRRVNIPAEDYGGLVCAVGQDSAEGCFGANSFDSCTCKCSGSNAATCTYWAYFTASYGKPWVYSALGYTQQRARDGDLQAWRWGRGGPNSAPAPPAINFEAVCGHAPRGGAVQQPTSAPATAAPPPSAPSTTGTVATDSATATPELTASVTLPTATTAAAGASATAAQTVAVSITSHGTATATPPPARGAAAGDDSGGARSLVAFGAVAALLVAAIAGALVWRRTHGS